MHASYRLTTKSSNYILSSSSLFFRFYFYLFLFFQGAISNQSYIFTLFRNNWDKNILNKLLITDGLCTIN